MIAELTTLAAEAVAVLSPLLTEAGKAAAKEMGKDAVPASGKLVGWLRTHLTGRGTEALGDLEKQPESEDNQADLHKQLAKLLEESPALADELRAMLPAARADMGVMTQTIGAGGQGAQIKGHGNNVTFGKKE